MILVDFSALDDASDSNSVIVEPNDNNFETPSQDVDNLHLLYILSIPPALFSNSDLLILPTLFSPEHLMCGEAPVIDNSNVTYKLPHLPNHLIYDSGEQCLTHLLKPSFTTQILTTNVTAEQTNATLWSEIEKPLVTVGAFLVVITASTYSIPIGVTIGTTSILSLSAFGIAQWYDDLDVDEKVKFVIYNSQGTLKHITMYVLSDKNSAKNIKQYLSPYILPCVSYVNNLQMHLLYHAPFESAMIIGLSGVAGYMIYKSYNSTNEVVSFSTIDYAQFTAIGTLISFLTYKLISITPRTIEFKNYAVSTYSTNIITIAVISIISNLIANSQSDIENAIIFDEKDSKKFKVELDPFWQYRAPMAFYKRTVKELAGDGFTLCCTKKFHEFKVASTVAHFSANFPIAVYYNDFDYLTFIKTFSASFLKYFGEFLGWTIFGKINNRYFKDNNGPKFAALVVGTFFYNFAKFYPHQFPWVPKNNTMIDA